ncbi:hypothetical protein BDW02DRAFT_617069 [Decorospora gaudefroyi]|uniref:Uncharacterized protein n=1 Tax=Decorospora gaudefroyi TaxID=184978 RepID=A0A6A5KNU8_9PLEO|nr:hypothetical protein BDW02DRAFT_617069 [Decorospora gaudefroyi]
MTKVKASAELITHTIPAVALPNSSLFVTVRDEAGNPLIFSLGTNGVFYCFKEDSRDGLRVLFNLNKAFGVPDGVKTTAFDVSQGTDDRLYLAFAFETSNESKTPLIVTYPFSPAAIDVAVGEDLNLENLILPEGGGTHTSIQKIYMGPVCKRANYPDVFLAYKPLANVHKSADITRIHVEKDYNHWCVMSDLELPENATQIIDFCPAFLRFGSGFFLLYAIQGETQLIFSSTKDEDGFLFQVSLDCPEGAKCLATIQDGNGFSSLLVGGRALWFWDTLSVQRNAPGRLISDDEGFEDVMQLYVTQNSKAVSVFATNSDLGLSYMTTSSKTFQEPLRAEPLRVVPLIPEGMGGTFSPFLSVNSDTQQLLCSSPSNTELTLLQQDITTGAWTTKLLYLPSLQESIQFDAFIVTINVTEDNNKPMPLADLMLESEEGWVSMLICGSEKLVGPDGTMIQTDPTGSVVLIIPSEDMTVGTFKLSHADLAEPVVVDPAANIFKKLDTINSGNDLRNARTSLGDPVLEGANLTNEEIDQLGEGIKALNEGRRNMQAGTIRDGDDEGRVIAGSSKLPFGGKIRNAYRDWFHFIKRANPVYWWIQIGKKGLEIIVQLKEGKSFQSIVIETANDLLNAVTTLWESIQHAWETAEEGWEKLKAFLKMLFNWDKIVEFKDGLVGLFEGACEMAVELIPLLEDRVEDFFDGIKEHIADFVYPDALDNIKEYDTVDAGGMDDETTASFSFVKEQLGINNPRTRSVRIEGESGPLDTGNEFLDMLAPLEQALGEAFERLQDTLSQQHFKSGNMSLKDTLQTVMGDVALGVIDIIKGVVQALLRIAGNAITLFKVFLTFKFPIPVFEEIYKRLTHKKPPRFSILDVVGIAIAISAGALNGEWFALPTKNEFKAFFGSRPSSGSPTFSKSIPKQSAMFKLDRPATKNSNPESEAVHWLVDIPIEHKMRFLKTNHSARIIKWLIDTFARFPVEDRMVSDHANLLKVSSIAMGFIRVIATIPWGTGTNLGETADTERDVRVARAKMWAWGMSVILTVFNIRMAIPPINPLMDKMRNMVGVLVNFTVLGLQVPVLKDFLEKTKEDTALTTSVRDTRLRLVKIQISDLAFCLFSQVWYLGALATPLPDKIFPYGIGVVSEEIAVVLGAAGTVPLFPQAHLDDVYSTPSDPGY